MENPADICKTGIPMSEKGNFHFKSITQRSEVVSSVTVFNLEDHDYPGNSFVNLGDPPCENDAYIDNSLQDGFQSQVFCSLVDDAGLQADLCIPENSAVDMGTVSQEDARINFTDSPGASFSCKIEPFSPMEGLVSSLDEQLDNYLLDELKETHSHSEDCSPSVDEQQRNVTEAICDIAKSFGLEDLLPETFTVDSSKDLCVNITTSDLCDDDNIGELSLGDFDRCPELNSPVNSLNIENIAENYVLSDLEVTSESQTPVCCVSKSSQDSVKVCKQSSGGELLSNKATNDSVKSKNAEDSEIRAKSVHQTEQLCDQNSIHHIYVSEDKLYDVSDQMNDIPTVSISDAEIGDSKETNENCHAAGTVLFTADKASKKMQIVLTLEQGQQIYDIDTDSVDASQQAIDLDLSSTFLEENLQEQILDDESVNNEEIHVSADGEDDINPSFDGNQDLVAEYVCNIPPAKMKKIKMVWLCPVEGCGQIMDKECKFRVHMISHKGARPFKCSYEGCDWAFTTPYRLRRHEETHLGCKDFICDFEGCNRKFTTVYNLKTHKKRHKWPNSLKCPSTGCEMSFANKRKLELHLRVHDDVEAPYKCTLCGKRYYSANCIASHYRTHQYNEDDFKCPFQGCGKIYDKICRLRQHVRHHTGDRPYTCPAEGCKWSFMSASKLTRHMRKHTGERKFVCTEPGCGKSFMRPEHLKGHKVIHSGDRPFHCPHENCNAKFTAKSSLYVHVKKHCSSVLKVVYPCPVEACLKKYNSKATLKQHVQKLHPELLQDGKLVNILEKLELTMPVSVVDESEHNLQFLDLEEIITDDPLLGLEFQDNRQSITPSIGKSATKTVSKVAQATSSQSQSSQPKSRESKKTSRSVKKIKPLRLSQINKSGCARTDYCCKITVEKTETQGSFLYLNPNSNDNDSRSYLLNNPLPTDIKSPDIMLTASIINHEIPSDHFLKSQFSSDSSSSSHSLYADESLLVSSGAFGSDLMPVSLLSDGVDSEDSVLNSDSTGIVFSEQTAVDAFSEHLHGLD